MELDHFVIGSSFDASTSHDCEQNDSPAAPPADVPDSPNFDGFTADEVLDFEVSANLILPNTCFKPISADGQTFDLSNEAEDGILFLDLEDWSSCEDPNISCLYDLPDLDPMAALLAFNASCTSPCNLPCNRSFDFKTPPETKFPVNEHGSDPAASSCSSSYSSYRSSYGSSVQTSPSPVAPPPAPTPQPTGHSSQFACSLSQQQQRYHHSCPAVSPPSPPYHLSPNSYPTSPAYFCNPSPQNAALSQSAHGQVQAASNQHNPIGQLTNAAEGYAGQAAPVGAGGHYSTASVSVNLSMNMTMGFAPPDPQQPLQWSMPPAAYGNSNYANTGYQVQSYTPPHHQPQQPHQSHGHLMTHHQSAAGSNESGLHAASAYSSVPLHELRAVSCADQAVNPLPPIEKEFSNVCSFRPSLSPSPVTTAANFPTPVLAVGCSPYQLRETSARFYTAASLRSQRKCFSRSPFPELPPTGVPGDLIMPQDSHNNFYTTIRTDDQEQLGADDPSRQSQERRGSPSEGPLTCNLCRICGKTYARPSTLKTHLRTHSGERPYRCEHCHKSFSQAANLTAHIRTHSGEKPFRCLICERRFSQSSSVTTHMRTHSGERPYRCRMCKKAFSDSSTLTKHLRIHSGEKPYVCRLCNLRFSQSGNLNRHMRIHSPLM